MLRDLVGIRGKVRKSTTLAVDSRIYPEGLLLQEWDTMKVKQADGVHRYSELPYSLPNLPSVVSSEIPIAFNSAGLLTGDKPLYTPAVGDLLIDLWVEITQSWNGTTPKLDVGTFVESDLGLFSQVSGAVDLTVTEDIADVGEGYAWNPSVPALSGSGISIGYRAVPGKFTAVNPLKVCVSTTGATDGADPGSTQGSAIVHLLTVPA